MEDGAATYTAFSADQQIAAGPLPEVARAVHVAARRGRDRILVFSDSDGEQVELDLRRGPEGAVAEFESRTAPRLDPPPRAGRGRPRLGVVAREVTLLPRHWQWLATQPGGASAALRRLVEAARRTA